MSFTRAYHRGKLILSVIVILIVGSCIARIEWNRAMHFEEATASVGSVEVHCYMAGGREEGDCDAAPPGANRITYLQLSWAGPDNVAHDGWARCVTMKEETRTYSVGQTLDLLIDSRDPGKIDLAKCSQVSGP